MEMATGMVRALREIPVWPVAGGLVTGGPRRWDPSERAGVFSGVPLGVEKEAGGVCAEAWAAGCVEELPVQAGYGPLVLAGGHDRGRARG